MSDDSRHEQVLDHLLGLQARLRGDAHSRRPAPVAPEGTGSEPAPPAADAPAGSGPASTLRLAPDLAVRHGDVEVAAGRAGTDADRLVALSERLQRVERELTSAMERLRTAEARFVGEDDEPEPSSPGADPDVYRRVRQLQDLASERETRQRR